MLLSAARLDDGPLCSASAIAALRDHAIDAFPQESIGYIDRHGIYHRLENIAADPERFAIAAPREISGLMASGNLRALCHSHPGGPDCPSQSDMAAQMEFDLPFVICATNGQATAEPFAWGDTLLDERPLIGRAFRHGVDDCYSLIRAWWQRERGILLPDFARQWEWWGEAGDEGVERDLYSRHFADADFYSIDASEAREGDVWLASIRSPVPNHGGILLDRGLALHHAGLARSYDSTRLSRRDPIARWLPFVTHWLRRDHCSEQSTFMDH